MLGACVLSRDLSELQIESGDKKVQVKIILLFSKSNEIKGVVAMMSDGRPGLLPERLLQHALTVAAEQERVVDRLSEGEWVGYVSVVRC